MTVALAEKDDDKLKAGPVPKEALRYFRLKGLKPAMRYTQVWQQEHTAAFTVAKLTELRLLKHVREATQKALEDGQPFAEWKKNALPALEKSGWRSAVSDKALPSRLRTIFETNMRVARAVGQHERALKTARVMPFYILELGPSKDHRDEHVKLAGTILPVDHVFWHTHLPPYDWGCKCRVRQISKVEANKRGGESDEPEIEMVKWELPDGRSGWYPKGVHPSFAYPKDPKSRQKAFDADLLHAQKNRGPAKPQTDEPEEARAAKVVELLRAFVAWFNTHENSPTVTYARIEQPDPRAIAHRITDTGRRVLLELVEMCPGEFDTIGVTKFACDAKTARRYLTGELADAGLVGRRASQKYLGYHPTPRAREVCKAFKEAP